MVIDKRNRQRNPNTHILTYLLLLFTMNGLPLISIGCSSNSGTAAISDFSLSTSPSKVGLVAGMASQQVFVTSTGINGYNASVAVVLSGQPSGITAKPATFTLKPGMPQSITLTASAAALANSSTIILTGTSGSITHTTSFTLNVTAAPPPDFTLNTTPATISLTTGASGQQSTISAVAANGFIGTVSVSLSALPGGVTATPPYPSEQTHLFVAFWL